MPQNFAKTVTEKSGSTKQMLNSLENKVHHSIIPQSFSNIVGKIKCASI